jgi:crotonobetainyl-CoA:carnitine CoA-transferase CaiB-like acyl-CoA transferase
LAKRGARSDEINGIVEEWTLAHTAAEIEALCVAHDVPVGTAYSAADIMADPHMAARHDLVVIDDPVAGPHRQQAPFPRIAGETPSAPSAAPALGQHNGEVWKGIVGLTDDEFDDLLRGGVI